MGFRKSTIQRILGNFSFDEALEKAVEMLLSVK
jgi:hypothetical protein